MLARSKEFTRISVAFLFLIIIFPTLYSSAEIYEFERMWPTLQQPWYFFAPRETALDSKGYIYVTDSSNSRIVKLSSSGQFIKDWKLESDNHQPYAIAIDGNDHVYVPLEYCTRLQYGTTSCVCLLVVKIWTSSSVFEFQIPRQKIRGGGGRSSAGNSK